MQNRVLTTDFCVVGGGLAGICAAVAAAREGVKTVLVHDRPVLGGNASSEIRMWVCGAKGKDRKETGIVEEMLLENLYSNPERNYSRWDTVLYSICRREKNLTLLLNTVCLEASAENNLIRSIKAYSSVAQTWYNISAKLFADCSGDSILGVLSGAALRYGREAQGEFNESIAPLQADRKTMGPSCLLQCRETTEDHDFIPPEWANKYTDPSQFNYRAPELEGLQNFWWIEVGGNADALHDVDKHRDELLAIAYGVFDYLKNSPQTREKYRKWTLEWVGFLPGKRESYRYEGDLIQNQNHVAAEGKFEDIISYGGWPMDDHHPDGFHYPGEPNIFHPAPSPFGISYRTIYSRNINNLFCAGRNISVTHSALSSTRVMATCATLGQAAGTAAALALKYAVTPREVGQKHIAELQNTLMKNDMFLPGMRYKVSAVCAAANLTCEGLRSGMNRAFDNTDESWHAVCGDSAEYRWENPVWLNRTRLVFDSDLDRPEKNIIVLHLLDPQFCKTPATLVKRYKLEYKDTAGVWQSVGEFFNPGQRLVTLPLAIECTALKLTILETFGNSQIRVFAWDVE